MGQHDITFGSCTAGALLPLRASHCHGVPTVGPLCAHRRLTRWAKCSLGTTDRSPSHAPRPTSRNTPSLAMFVLGWCLTPRAWNLSDDVRVRWALHLRSPRFVGSATRHRRRSDWTRWCRHGSRPADSQSGKTPEHAGSDVEGPFEMGSYTFDGATLTMTTTSRRTVPTRQSHGRWPSLPMTMRRT